MEEDEAQLAASKAASEQMARRTRLRPLGKGALKKQAGALQHQPPSTLTDKRGILAKTVQGRSALLQQLATLSVLCLALFALFKHLCELWPHQALAAAGAYLIVSAVLGIVTPPQAHGPRPGGGVTAPPTNPSDSGPETDITASQVEPLVRHQLATIFHLAASVDRFHKSAQPFLGGVEADLMFGPANHSVEEDERMAFELMTTAPYQLPSLQWQLRSDRNGIRVATAALEGNDWDLTAGECVIRGVTAAQLTKFLTDDGLRSTFDTNFAGSEEMQSWNTQTCARAGPSATAPATPDASSAKLTTMSYRGKWPVCDRRFMVLNGHCRVEQQTPTGTFIDGNSYGALVATRSVGRAFRALVDRAPALRHRRTTLRTSASEVSAKLHIAGFRILPLLADEGGPRCHLVMVNHVDFGGNMPAGVINYVQTTVTPEILTLIQRHVVEYASSVDT